MGNRRLISTLWFIFDFIIMRLSPVFHLLVFITALTMTQTTLAEIFYPFGSSSGDSINPADDNGGSPVIPLSRSFLFFGSRYQQIYVSNNGFLTFTEPSTAFVPDSFPTYGGQDIIAGLWTDIDNRGGGVISHNQYTTGSVLTRATLDINRHFPDLTFSASLVFVATWDKVEYFGMTGTETSFQVVLISNSDSSFILMNYGDIAEPDEPVVAGYETSSTDSFVIPGSTNGSITNLKSSSNVDVPGQWALRVDSGLKLNQEITQISTFPLTTSALTSPSTSATSPSTTSTTTSASTSATTTSASATLAVFEPAVPTTAEGHLVVREEITQTSTSPLTTSASTSPSTFATSPSTTSTPTTSPPITSASTTLAGLITSGTTSGWQSQTSTFMLLLYSLLCALSFFMY